MSIKKSLRITILIFSLFPFIVIFAFTYWFTSERLNVMGKENLLSITNNSAKSINFMLNNISKANPHDVITLSSNILIHYLSELDPDKNIDFVLANSKSEFYYSSTESIKEKLPEDVISIIFNSYEEKSISTSDTLETTINGTDYIYAYYILPDYDLIMISLQKTSDIADIPHTILPIALGSLFIILPFAIVIIRHFTKVYTNPLIDLRNAIRSASNGNLNVHASYKSNNEIGELSRNFNKMIYMIKNNYDELSAMHEKLVCNEDQLRTNFNRIEFLAYHDVLTTLPNKLSFNEHIDNILAASSLYVDKHAIFFIDLDNFKIINDTLGHEYGDLLLVQTAERLRSLAIDNDCIARAGGDEFLLFKANIPSEEYTLEFGQSIIDQFKVPFDLNGESAYISLSLGVALYPENGLDSHVLIKNADIAMYSSKETGKNRCTLFDNSMEELLYRNSLILEVLRNCIANEEIYLLYQPQINAKENRIIGFEALMRIYNSKLGLISPKEFIPIAEESGLIFELGAWALKEACLVNKQLLDSGTTPCTISVNISPVQINHFDFFTTLSSILKETGLPPKYLELELTESALVHSLMDTATLIKKLQDIGVKIALDDFGTGYSSLSYLAKMSINTLKIDKSFIDNICGSEKELSMVHTIIRLAHHLGIQVVAEGVEHHSQLVLLKEKKCDSIQGFVYSKPLLIQDLTKLLERTIHYSIKAKELIV